VKTSTQEKFEKLQKTIKKLKRVAIAYSGGVDSTFLIKIAYDVLGENAFAVTAVSPTYTKQELIQAQHSAQKIGIHHIIIKTKETESKHFIKNPTNRCYFCKKELFTKIQKLAQENDIKHILDGSNIDDNLDYRPGQKALREMHILSPLRDVGLTKQEIRDLLKKTGLKGWNTPANACLASRFPYGVQITKQRLKQVEQAESYLTKIGIKNVRVRYHYEIARIEVEKKEFKKIITNAEKITKRFKQLGFKYITLDIQGYRMGSLNEVFSS
jgi:pyridinium-3,5-biscarboxylic acid mononucleotide sulfurtransferase